MTRSLSFFLIGCIAGMFMTSEQASAQSLTYPKTRKQDQVDAFFGTKVSDPYRWLENDVREDKEVEKWVEAQNKVTFSYINKLPYREEIKERLTELWDFEKFGTPFRRGGRYYFTKNDGLQNQSVLYVQNSLDDEPRELLDPNKWSKDGTVALAGTAFSDDGKYMAYGVQKSGSDWRTWKIMEIASKKVLDDSLEWIKFGGVAWAKDGKGFFYSRYPEPEKGEEFTSLNKNMKVYFHKVGTPQSADKLIHADPENPDWGFGLDATEDGRFLVITVWKGTADKYRVLYKDLQKAGSKVVKLIDSFDHEFTFFGNEGNVLYFKTDVESPNKNVLGVNVYHPEKESWKVIVPEAKEVLDDVGMVGDHIICHYLKDAKTLIKLHDLQGKFVRDVSFPGIGTASGFGGKRSHSETFYSFASFATPPSIYRYDMKTGKSELLRRAQVDFDPERYIVVQKFYKSKDGTRVPMFIAHKKGLKLDGANPTLLYGYGGFNISLTPRFSITRLQWMEMGGVFAMPNLRGGGEYGEAWHQGGMKTRKQNVFDDFIAAAQFLIDSKITSSKHLAIQGGSNGGLLVGACMTQRPDLFGACLPAVGVMDMLRFQKFTAGRFWVDDYGNADADEDEFKALYAYSPYHNLKDGTSYPPTMVTTADTDDRVVPGHSFKFAARLQEAHKGKSPVLIRIETKAGHGSGKPTAKIIEEYADQWAFLAKYLGMKPEFKK